MSLSIRRERQRLTAVRVESRTAWFAYLIALPGLPLKADERPELYAAVSALLQRLQGLLVADLTVWLELDHLHKDNAIRQVGKHGPAWSPEMGLGVRPQEEPPRYWTEDDLMNRDHTSPMPALMHNVLLLNAEGVHRLQASEVMTGTGGLTQVLHRCTREELRTTWYDLLQPTIVEEGLAAYPVYLPVLSLASLGEGCLPLVERCLREVDVYVRESVEDRGVLLLSKQSLEREFEEAGLMQRAD